MGGFAGAFAHQDQSALPARIQAMREGIWQRPGESTGEHVTTKDGIGIGWSLTTGEQTSNLAWNAEGDIGICIQGEIFGPPGQDSAQHLLREFIQHGLQALVATNGRISGVILDHRAGEFHVFNDRHGLERVYCHEASDGFYFSTHARALLAALPGLRELDWRGVAEFLAVGCVLQNRSLFKSISILPPASIWTFRRGRELRKQTYFEPRTWEEQEPLSPRDYSEVLRETFARACQRYTTASRPVGLSLTGGLDSRMVLAWSGAAPGALPCYTFGGPYRDCADVRIARQLARVAGQPHTTLHIGSDFFAQFLNLAKETILATDGTMDASGAVELYVNKLAREIAPVRLTGNYGSEILRSNVAFGPFRHDRSLFTPEFRGLLDDAVETYRNERQGRRLSFIAFKQVPWYHHARFAAERSQLSPRSPFLDPELVAVAYRAPAELEGSAAPLLQLITSGNPALDAVDTDRALASQKTLLGPARHAWREFTAKAEYAYDYGMPQWVVNVDRVLKPLHLERLFLGRHKFYHFRVWYRDRLSQALQQHFAGADQPSCYLPGVAKRLVAEHTSGRVNRTLEMHRLLSIDLIERLLINARCRT